MTRLVPLTRRAGDAFYRGRGRTPVDGRPPEPPPEDPLTQRNALLRVVHETGCPAGMYVPGITPNSVGMYDPDVTDSTGEVFDGVIKPTSAGAYSVFPRIIIAGTRRLYLNAHFRAPIFADATTQAGTYVFRNCRISGLNPQVVQALYDQHGETNATKEAASGVVNYRPGVIFRFEDCTFDNGWWYDRQLSNRISTLWSFGAHGGNIEMYRCEITRYTDGFNFAGGPCGVDQHVTIDRSWIHGGFYANNITAPPGAPWTPQDRAYTHSDAFQFNTGRNVKITRSLLGGMRNPFSQRVSIPYLPGGSTGDDYDNTTLMWQQESTSTAVADIVDNVDIGGATPEEGNWLAGGTGTVQLVLKNGNTMPGPGLVANRIGCRLRNNRILVRQTGWGTTSGSPGYYIMRSVGMQTEIVGNVLWALNGSIRGNGQAAPIQAP